MMKQASETASIRALLRQRVRAEGPLVFVPTMGNLHAGHLSLVENARARGGDVIVSIFVNPMQFGATEDLDSYPRTLEADIDQLEATGCDYLFTPGLSEIYPEGVEAHSVVHVPELTRDYCGASRPRHFDGVATVVAKLFQIIQPDVALFGLKDYQQYMVIRKMVADLCMPVKVEGAEIVREKSGLALSSRNGYLSEAERRVAPGLYAVLLEAEKALRTEPDFERIEKLSLEALRDRGFRPDYFRIASAHTLKAAQTGDRDLVILAAAWLGETRLIDNLRLSL